jgi:transposase-like protein
MIAWLRQMEVLKTTLTCIECSRIMNTIADASRLDGYIMRCSVCKSKLSIRSSSVLFQSKIHLRNFIHLVYLWTQQLSLGQIARLLVMDENTVRKLLFLCRSVCSWQLSRMDLRLGGEGRTVQVDESIINRAKYQRGHALYQSPKWVLGIYDAERKVGVTRLVANRGANTLLPLIQQLVLPGTIIYTDGWRGYIGIPEISVEPRYIHRTVNHSRYFVNPSTGVHTNNVEAYWSSIKRKFKAISGTTRELTQMYLDEHAYRQRFSGVESDLFHMFIEHCGQFPALQ